MTFVRKHWVLLAAVAVLLYLYLRTRKPAASKPTDAQVVAAMLGPRDATSYTGPVSASTAANNTALISISNGGAGIDPANIYDPNQDYIVV